MIKELPKFIKKNSISLKNSPLIRAIGLKVKSLNKIKLIFIK